MRSKNVDFALVGHNFFTFLLSIDLLRRGKKVLILDDDRFNYGDFFTNSLTSLDVQFLKAWGEKNGIAPLLNIEEYLSPERVYFFVGKKQVVLGDFPHRNFRELCRKFPHLFSAPTDDLGLFSHENQIMAFDSVYNDFCQKVTTLLFQGKGAAKSPFVFESSMTREMEVRFEHFFARFFTEGGWEDNAMGEFKSLVFMARGFFQNRPAVSGNRSELMHLFFSLISPYYKLDHEKLIADLLKDHLENGGEFKQLNLAELKFQKGLITSFELESYDGLIRPHKMIFIGGGPMEFAPKFRPQHSTIYTCLNVLFEFGEDVPPLLEKKKCVFTSPIKIGTDQPFWEVYFEGRRAVFNIIIGKAEGNKIDFVFERIKTMLISDLHYLFPEYSFLLQKCDMKFTLDVFIEDKNYEAHHRKLGLRKRIAEMWEDRTPRLFLGLKNVIYFGPSKENSLGTFSSLMKIKRWRDTL